MIQVSARRLTLFWIDLMVLAFALAHLCFLVTAYPPGFSLTQVELHGLHDEAMLDKVFWVFAMGFLGVFASLFGAFALISYRHSVKPFGKYSLLLWGLVCLAPAGVFWVYHLGGRRALKQGLWAHP